jgi:hypothetical protein
MILLKWLWRKLITKLHRKIISQMENVSGRNISWRIPCTTMEGSVKIDEECGADADQVDDSEGKRPAELEPPRVLEVPFAPLDVFYITHLSQSRITVTIVNSIPDLIFLLSL